MVIDAYIPARSGSTRVIGKNTRLLAGHPLIAYTIAAALQSGIFRSVIVSSDSQAILDIAKSYGADVVLRSQGASGDLSVDWAGLYELFDPMAKKPDYFCILYPTAPFRGPELVRLAWKYFQQNEYATGLISVVSTTPIEKTWHLDGQFIVPAIQKPPINGHPAYNCPSQILEPAYKQTAAIKIGDIRSVVVRRDLFGNKIIPFFMNEFDGLDINTEEDFARAKSLVEKKIATLPII